MPSPVGSPLPLSSPPREPVPVVGMVRGGQLALMTAHAAERLGVPLRVLDPDPGCPAAQAGAEIVVGDPAVLADLERFCAAVDVVCFDDESVPLEHLEALERSGVQLLPSPGAAGLAFDKAAGRRWMAAHRLPLPELAEAAGTGDVIAFGERVGWPVVVKAPRRGYDGRGVCIVDDAAGAAEVVTRFGAPVLVEELVDYDAEVAVTVARSGAGRMVTFPPVRTVQRDGVCRQVMWPSGLGEELDRAATELAGHLAETAGVRGLMTVELFVVRNRLVVNELAMRPHNSAHLTIDAFDVSQFELLLLAAAGRDLPVPEPVAPAAVMVNLLGDPDGAAPRVGQPSPDGVRVHWYGKPPAPGRKLGHLTAVGDEGGTLSALLADLVDGTASATGRRS